MKCTESVMKWQVKHSHFLSHLRSSKVKFLQADDVAILELVHLVAFGTEQGFIGQDELQVRSRSDVIMSAQLGVIALRHLSHTLLERFTHFHHPENNAKQTMWAFIFQYYHLLKVIYLAYDRTLSWCGLPGPDPQGTCWQPFPEHLWARPETSLWCSSWSEMGTSWDDCGSLHLLGSLLLGQTCTQFTNKNNYIQYRNTV